MSDQNSSDADGVLAAARRRALVVLAVTGALCAFFLWASADLHDRLARGGFTATGTASARAEALAAHYGADRPDLVFLLTPGSWQSLDAPAITHAAHRLTGHLRSDAGVEEVRSAWEGAQPSALRSGDGRAGLIVTYLAGGEDTASRAAERLVPRLTDLESPVTVHVAGPAWTTAVATQTAADELLRAELIAAPLILLVLAWAFRSVAAAVLPVLVGGIAVLGAMAVLRALSEAMQISVFAQNLVGGLGFGLAVDYALFMVSRYREERRGGTDPATAVAVAIRTVGRTITASACTLCAGLAVLLVFPFPFLQSMACAGITVTILAACASILVIPAALTLFGPWIDYTDPLRYVSRTSPPPADDSRTWHALARTVTRRPVLSGAAVLAVLTLFLVPFAHVRLALPDHRILSSDASARTDTELLDRLFPGQAGHLTVVLPAIRSATDRPGLDQYGRALSDLDHVYAVQIDALGTYQNGRRTSPALTTADAARQMPPKGAVVTVAATPAPHTQAATELVRDLRALPAPGPAHVAGPAAENVDAQAALADRLPLAAALLALVTFAVTACYTRSILVPVKVVAVAAVSLTAALGGVVLVFQDGHLGGWTDGTATTGSVDATMPVLLFCIAFGLTADYELLLLARIQEHYRTTRDTTASIIHGITRTGRVFTAAALAVAVAMAALATSSITLLQQLGFGIVLAVVIDATLVRGVLVPAIMQLMGHANWWTPATRSNRPPARAPSSRDVSPPTAAPAHPLPPK